MRLCVRRRIDFWKWNFSALEIESQERLVGIEWKGRRSWYALAGNRTRASRVAGENSTTEPPVLARMMLPDNTMDKTG